MLMRQIHKKVYSVSEVAKMFDMSDSGILLWIKRGVLP
jgi:hypothetical protein